jgi:hypothetical protein
VRFPKVIRHRKSEATIYGKSKRYPFYRVVYRVAGKRRMKSVAAYSEARDFHDEFGALRDSVKIPARRNGLRHGFVSFHFALNANENLTAAEAGNSPAMVHKNYKGLATKAEGEAWFNVQPPTMAENVIAMPAKKYSGHNAPAQISVLTARLFVGASERLAHLPNHTGNVCRS